MKTLFIGDVLRGVKRDGTQVTLLCWLKARRDQGRIVFIDLVDSTGTIQAMSNHDHESVTDLAKTIPLESAVEAMGTVHQGPKGPEIHLNDIKVVGLAESGFSPRPRSNFDPFDPNMVDHMLAKRYLYIRNPKAAAVLRYRHLIMEAARNWFSSRGYIELTAPVLTLTPLYEDDSAMGLQVNGEPAFLTQCVGFYLEAAVHSFERCYNMGPSFRAEESRSKRHLMEYWHIKAELAWVSLEDLVDIVEDFVSHLVRFSQDHCQDIFKTLGTVLKPDGMEIPFPRIKYSDAVERLQDLGMPFEFGSSLGSPEEELLSKQFTTPFWITGIPRSIEPFPYVIDKTDPRVTRTADLICSRGYGELLGIAEKIDNLAELDERMAEKGKAGDPRYEWLRHLRSNGCVPHGGFGMGAERAIRWLLGIEHVRDAMPFPRIFRRAITP